MADTSFIKDVVSIIDTTAGWIIGILLVGVSVVSSYWKNVMFRRETDLKIESLQEDIKSVKRRVIDGETRQERIEHKITEQALHMAEQSIKLEMTMKSIEDVKANTDQIKDLIISRQKNG